MENPIQHDGLRIDLESAEITRAGCPIYLSMNEYRVLLAFARNRGQAVSVQHLEEMLWDGYTSDCNAWAHIWRLRKKIELDPRNPVHIVTVPGGYMMPEEQ